MKKIFLAFVLMLILTGPAFAKDTGTTAAEISDACRQKIEKALREYDAYERQDTTIMPREEWLSLKREMHEMHMRMKEMHRDMQDMQGTMHQKSIQTHGQYNH